MNERLKPSSLWTYQEIVAQRCCFPLRSHSKNGAEPGSAWAHGLMLYPVDGTEFHCQFLSAYCEPGPEGWPSLGHVAITPTQRIHPLHLPCSRASHLYALDRQRCYWSSWLVYSTLISVHSLFHDPPNLHICSPCVLHGCLLGEQLFLPFFSEFPNGRMRPSPSFIVTGDSLAPG